MSIPIANFASCLGKYDSTIVGAVVSDTSNNAGSGDVSFNGGYVLNTRQFVLPPPLNGNGISFSGWFYPVGTEPVNTALFDMSCSAPVGTGNIAVYFSASNAMSMIYNGNSATTGTNTYIPNTWNFFMYTVCCSGTTVAVQNLYINTISTSANPATLTSATGTYTQFSVINTYLGFGNGSYGATKFAGKMDDFRFYSRVISPMEYRVLYGFNYGKAGMPVLTPTLGTVTAGTSVVNTVTNTATQSFNFSTNGTFSSIQVNRIIGLTTTKMLISAANLTYSPGSYNWTDTGLPGNTSYIYIFTPLTNTVVGTTLVKLLVTTCLIYQIPVIRYLFNNGDAYSLNSQYYVYNNSVSTTGAGVSENNIYPTQTSTRLTSFTGASTSKCSIAIAGGTYIIPSSLSLCFWFYCTNTGGDWIFNIQGDVFNTAINIVSYGASTFTIRDFWQLPSFDTQNVYNLNYNTWYHFAIVHDRVNRTSIYYINGVISNKNSYPYSSDLGTGANTTNRFSLGYAANSTGGYYQDFRLFTSAITQADINSIYNNGNGNPT